MRSVDSVIKVADTRNCLQMRSKGTLAYFKMRSWKEELNESRGVAGCKRKGEMGYRKCESTHETCSVPGE